MRPARARRLLRLPDARRWVAASLLLAFAAAAAAQPAEEPAPAEPPRRAALESPREDFATASKEVLGLTEEQLESEVRSWLKAGAK